MNWSASQYLSSLLCAFSVTLVGNTLTLLGKPQNNVSRKSKKRTQKTYRNSRQKKKLILNYSAVAWGREKHVIIGNSSAWTRRGESKVKGRVERKLSTFVLISQLLTFMLFSQQLKFMLLSKLIHHIVPSVGGSVYHKYRGNIFIVNFPTYPTKFYKKIF
jgi:hypothetical protein